MDINKIQQLTQDEMKKVDLMIQDRLKSDVALINQVSSYIIMNGGKRLRPQLLLLSALACGHKKDTHILLAVIIELIHTATLLHDDVVDASKLRRGKKTANELWGNEASVLVGDFIYSRAFELMVDAEDMRIMAIFSHATNNIAKGEVMQLMNCHDPETTEYRYMQVIQDKTAQLFSAAGRLGALISQTPEYEDGLTQYGQHLGIAFQLVDDIMDYESSSEILGKNIGDDLAEGKPTLPLIYALNNCSSNQAKIINDAIEENHHEVNIDEILAIIKETNAVDYTYQRALEQAKQAKAAIDTLPDTPYKQALLTLADFSVERKI